MRRVRTTAVVLLLIAGALFPVPVSADLFGTDNGTTTGPFADGAGHTYCWGPNFPAALKPNAGAAMAKLDTQTDMIDVFEASCGQPATSIVDVWWFETDLPGGVLGLYQCYRYAQPGVCESSNAFLDLVFINSLGSNDESQQTAVACHELGHSVGLTHSNAGQDCMRNGMIPNEANIYREYDGHHVSHINDRYN